MTSATLVDRAAETKQDEAAILRLIAGMAKARYDKDAEAIVAPYAQDASIFNLAPPLLHTGIHVPETRA